MKHPKLILIEGLNAQIKQLKREVDEEEREHRKELIPEYSYEIHAGVQKETGWHSKIESNQEYIVIRRNVTNMIIFDEHLNYYGSIMDKPKASVQSVKYYRKHGLLMHDGGGHCVLIDEEPCSDEEWEALKGGILGKFTRIRKAVNF
jgi:hypothetical protein